MKYIVTVNEKDEEEIFIFPKTVDHDCMAEVLMRIKNHSHGDWYRVPRKPIAAGFTDGKTCWGRSETLNMDSREDQDSILIK